MLSGSRWQAVQAGFGGCGGNHSGDHMPHPVGGEVRVGSTPQNELPATKRSHDSFPLARVHSLRLSHYRQWRWTMFCIALSKGIKAAPDYRRLDHGAPAFLLDVHGENPLQGRTR